MDQPEHKTRDARKSQPLERSRCDHFSRRRSTGAVADQSGSQCRGCHARNRRLRSSGLVPERRAARCLGARRRTWPPQYFKPIRSLFYDQARWVRYWTGPQPPDRRSTRRRVNVKESFRYAWVQSLASASRLDNTGDSLSGRNQSSSSGLRCRGILQTAFQVQFDLNDVVHFEEKVAGIFEAPIDKWHVELRTSSPVVSRKFRLHRHNQFVFAAVQNKNPVHLNRKDPLRRNFPFHAVWPKNDFGEFPAFENVFMHFLVAPIVAAVSACRAYGDLTTGFAGRGVNVEGPILESKRSMNRMQRCAKHPVHFALRGIDAQNNFRCRKLRRGVLRQSAEHNYGQGSCHKKIENSSQRASRPMHSFCSLHLRGQKLPAEAHTRGCQKTGRSFSHMSGQQS